MRFIIILGNFNNQKFEKVVILRKNIEQKSFAFINFALSQQSQVTAECSDMALQSIHTCSSYISTHILQKQPLEKLFKVIPLNKQTSSLIEIYLSSIYFDMSLEGSITENIDELI